MTSVKKDKQDDVCVTKMSTEISTKHPLQNTWSIWYFKNDRSKKWEDNLIEIASFQTVEDFWAVYNHLEIASKLSMGSDYAMFKTGIKPMWEDKKNQQGGRWIINLQKFQSNPDVNSCWLEVLLCLVGEAFDEYGDDVCGAVVQIRGKADKLGLWTANFGNGNAIMKIGQIFKERLRLPSRNGKIAYEAHSR